MLFLFRFIHMNNLLFAEFMFISDYVDHEIHSFKKNAY